MNDKYEFENAEIALRVVLDQIDYTAGACEPTEMIAAVLPTDVLEMAKRALDRAQKRRDDE